MKTILVVCEGNICRSPMAAALLDAALPDCRVVSAGLGALVGKPADDAAVALMRERGLDLRAHRAEQITRPMSLHSDLILVMESQQRERLQRLYPEVCGRVFTIAEHAGVDVPDPYRQPIGAFRTALALIERGVAHWAQRIQRL
jgi:protein-tyrosine phosphatase